jgi:hypothetical protein
MSNILRQRIAISAGNTGTIHTNVTFVRAFAVQTTFCTHIRNTDFSFPAVSISTAFDIIFALIRCIANFAFRTFRITQAFRTRDASTIQTNLTFLAIAVDSTFSWRKTYTIDAQSAFTLRTKDTLNFFRCVTDIRLARNATTFCANHLI